MTEVSRRPAEVRDLVFGSNEISSLLHEMSRGGGRAGAAVRLRMYDLAVEISLFSQEHLNWIKVIKDKFVFM